MTTDKNENTVFDPPGAIFTGIFGMVEMFDSRDSNPVLFPDTGDTMSTLSGDSMDFSFCIVMAKRHNSGLSAR